MKKEDRYLQLFRGRWRYYRRVPKAVSHIDSRKIIQIALGTANIEIARIRRDGFEEADDLYWSALMSGGDPEAAGNRYEAAKSRAKALGVTFKSLDELVQSAPLEELAERILLLRGKKGAQLQADSEAVLGAVKPERLKLSKAYDVFIQKCAAEALSGKSEKQIKSYKKVKLRAVNNFIKINGDLHIDEITDEHAQRVFDWWSDRITGKNSGKRMSGNSGNRDIGNLRLIYREVFKRQGDKKRPNPFDGLSFQDPKRLKEDVPPFPTVWIRDKLLIAESYSRLPDQRRSTGLNNQALKIWLTVIETGCRPSEVCNLVPNRIHLEHDIPHIEVNFDPDREIKTESSTRKIPLVGIAFEAVKRSPDGFPRYKDKEDTFSAVIMKHLRSRNLLPSASHIAYSARHSFEDRMKKAHIDSEMRRLLMGHSIDREEYGEGGDLELRLELLKRIELPFDERLLDLMDGRPI
jgi:integrase